MAHIRQWPTYGDVAIHMCMIETLFRLVKSLHSDVFCTLTSEWTHRHCIVIMMAA